MANNIKIGTQVVTTGLTRGFQSARQQLTGFQKDILSVGARVTNATDSFVTGFAKVGLAVQGVSSIVSGLKSLIGTPLRLAGEFESVSVQMEVMTHSASTAASLIQDIKTMGSATPFEFAGLSQTVSKLLAFSRTADVVMEDLHLLSNVASGSQDKLNTLALAFGKAASAGKFTTENLNMMIDTGFNPANLIIAKTGETMTEFQKRMSAGNVKFEEMRDAFVTATSAGGDFFQMNEKQSKTLLGRWSSLQDEIGNALLSVGNQISETFDLQNAIASTSALVASWQKDFAPVLQVVLNAAKGIFETFYKLSGTFKVLVPIIGGVVTALAAIVIVQKSIIAAQKLVLALSGPKGWGILAAGIAIAYGSTLLLSNEMKKLDANTSAAVSTSNSAAESITKVGTAADTTTTKIQKLESANEHYAKTLKDIGSKQASLRDAIALESGQETELDQQVRGFESQGVDQSDISYYKRLYEQLQLVRKENEKINSLRSTAEQIKDSLLTDEQRYNKELEALREMHSKMLLSTDEYYAALTQAGERHRKEQAEKEKDSAKGGLNTNLFQVAEFGSQEARSAILKNRINGSVENKEQKEIASNTKVSAEAQRELLELWRQDRKARAEKTVSVI